MPEMQPLTPDKKPERPYSPPVIYVTLEQAKKMQEEPLPCPFCEAGFPKVEA